MIIDSIYIIKENTKMLNLLHKKRFKLYKFQSRKENIFIKRIKERWR